MRISARLRLAALLLAALAGCARSAPPAPVVAGGASPAASGAPLAPQPSVPHPDRVVVQQGETLYGVARRYDVPVRSLIEANDLAPPYRLAAGNSLVVPQIRQHVVEPGDTLYSISRRYGVDTSTLARSNGLEPPYRVRVGQSLLLPAAVESARTPVIQATAPASAYAAAAAAPSSAEAAPPPPTAAPPPREEKPVSVPPAEKAVAPPGEEKTATLPPPPAPAGREGRSSFLWPVHGRIIAAYGDGAGGTHNDGINIAAPEGTAVLAADAGIVAYAGNELRGYGNLVLIKHADGWMTAYAHNSALLVKRGERVRRGQPIARVGATGAVGEPQLHFEIRHGTRALDPGDYLPQAAATAARG
jgi:murein DD-endopeptidase MepM/ murein hydrolase activator NlpD